MPLETFQQLCTWVKEHNLLQPTCTISVEEQIAIFMKIVGENASNRAVQDRFQHSGDTVHTHFHNVLKVFIQLYTKFVQLPKPTTPHQIRGSSKLFPYFQDCIGVADGTHIPARAPNKDIV